MGAFVRKVLKAYVMIERVVLTTIFTGMFVLMFASVIARYFFSSPIMFTEELLVTVTPCMVILGIGYGIRTRSHISVDLFYRKLPEKWKCMISIVLCIIMIYALVLVYQNSFSYIQQQLKGHMITLPSVSKGVLYYSVPIGVAIGIIYLVLDIFDQLLRLLGKTPIFDFKSGGAFIE